MPKQHVEIVKYKSRIIVNSMFKNVQSANWKSDYKRFAGMSYADVVKCKNRPNSTLDRSKKCKVGSHVKNSIYTRTHVPKTHVRAPDHSKPLMKPSDVHSTLTITDPVKSVHDKCANHVNNADIQLHNRFDVFNSIHDIDSTEISNVSDIESHVIVCSEPSMQDFHYVNTGERSKKTNENKIGNNVQCKVQHDNADRITKNWQKTSIKNTGKNSSKEFILKEYEDKYDLELRFKPKYRQRVSEAKNNCTFKNWDNQMEEKYGFVPLGDILVPKRDDKNPAIGNIKALHQTVKNSKNFNFIESQIQVESQLNPEVWERYLKYYWDKQLCFLIRYGFPLDHKQESPLKHDFKNHSTATDYENDVKAYLQEEKQFGAILGPYNSCPLDNMHFSPFLTREKPGAPHRRVIVDLSYPEGFSVNAGVDSDKYLDTPFILTLPTIDNITQKVKENGKGSMLYKIDLSRAFRHVKIDPKDYNLLGLQISNEIFYDSCLPFGFKHGSAIFQRISDSIRYIMNSLGFKVTNYIDDIIGHSVCSQANDSFRTLFKILTELGFDISQKKIVTPSTKVTCLGVDIDTEKFTISIPSDKVSEIIQTCHNWSSKKFCTKRDLQSLLGKLLYITKCVKSSRFFLNRMLEVLRNSQKRVKIQLTPEFHRDLNWFIEFIPKFNGSAFFVHHNIQYEIELDACLQGLGARCGDQVYAIEIPLNFENMGIVHLEMINILVAIRTWATLWKGKNIRIHCDNQAVVSVLTTGKTRDSRLAAIARNIFMEIAAYDICLRTVHISGKNNQVADNLSRFFLGNIYRERLYQSLKHPTWVPVPHDALNINWDI